MIYVVPSLKDKEKLQCEGKAWAESQGFAYVPRGKRTIQDLMDEYGEDFLVYSSRGPQIDRLEGVPISSSATWLNCASRTCGKASATISWKP